MGKSWSPSSNFTSSQETNSIPSALTLGLDQSNYFLLSYILAILTASLPYRSPLRNGFLLLQVGFLAQAYLARPNPDQNTAVTYMGGLALGTMTARYFDRLYSHVPEKEFHRINPDASKEDATKLSWPAKLFWAFELITVTRGVGWDWRVPGIPKAESQTRFKFLGVRFVKYIAMYTGLYLVGLFSQEIRTGFKSISNPPLKDLAVSITSNAAFLYVFIVFVYAVSIYSHFGIMTLPLSMICVGLKVGPRSWQQQESWPPNFGSLKEAYSIRRFWGFTWHQQLRRTVGSPARALLSLLPSSLLASKSRPARLFRRYFLVLASFFISGCIHACGSISVTRAKGYPVSDGGEMAYFLLQGVALAVEDFALWVLGVDDRAKQGPSSLRRWVGYGVTSTWYIWSRVALKVVPLAFAHGFKDERGPLFQALALVERGAIAVPGNFVAWAFGGYLLE